MLVKHQYDIWHIKRRSGKKPLKYHCGIVLATSEKEALKIAKEEFPSSQPHKVTKKLEKKG